MSDIPADRCANCGGTELLALGDDRFRCSYCNAILRRPPQVRRGNVEIEIRRGAKVEIKPGAHVVLRNTVGKLTIEEGAEVQIAGTLEIEEPGDPTKRR